MSNLKKTAAYAAWKERGENEGLFFIYESKGYANSYRRKIILLQNLDFFSKDQEKMLKIEFDYNSMMRMLRRMKFDNEVLICQGDEIVLSNGPFSGVGKNLTRSVYSRRWDTNRPLHFTELNLIFMF